MEVLDYDYDWDRLSSWKGYNGAEDYIRSCGEYRNDDEFEALVEIARDSIVTEWRKLH